MNPKIQGAVRSKTMWAGALLITLSNLATAMPAICLALHLDPLTTQLVGTVFGAVMMGLRYVTTQPLEAKTAPDILPPPKSPTL